MAGINRRVEAVGEEADRPDEDTVDGLETVISPTIDALLLGALTVAGTVGLLVLL